MSRGGRRAAIWAMAGAAAAALGLGLLLRSWSRPVPGWEASDDGKIIGPSAPEGAPPPLVTPVAGPRRLTVLTWNLAYGQGAGPAAAQDERPPKAGYDTRLARAAALIKSLAPDLVLLQEVDFASRRSYGENQLETLRAATGLPYAALAISWSAAYVPYPGLMPAAHLGQVAAGGAVLSRLPITSQVIVRQPPPPSHPGWCDVFFPTRYTQVVRVMADGEPLVVLNNHLEDRDAASRREQAEMVAALAQTNAALVVGGDLNAGPADPSVDLLRQSPSLKDAFREAHGAGADGGYKTYPSVAPTERLDQVLIGADSTAEKAEIETAAGDISDHLPVLVVVRW